MARFIVAFVCREREEADRLAALRPKGYAALGVMENALTETPYFAGEAFSVADIALYAYTHVADEGGFDLGGYPQIRGWLARVEQAPGFLGMAEACR